MSTSSLTIDASVLTLPLEQAALTGVNTPLGGLSITGPETAAVTVIITAAFGTLSAGTFPGAIVSGGGTSSLWIAGSPAQVSAKLATLVYFATAATADTLSVSVIDSSGPTSGPRLVPVDVLPLITPATLASPALTIQGGTLALDERQVDGITLNIHDADTGAGAATLVLDHSSLGANTLLDVASSNPASAAPRLAIAGQVSLDGATIFEAGAALVTLAQNATLLNEGRIAFNGSSAQLTGGGTLQNDGTLVIGAAANPVIDGGITGSGVLSLAAGSELALGGPVSASQSIRFETNSGVLELDAPQSMQATIAGFVPGDKILLGELQISATDYTPTGAGGTLTLYDGAQVSASLHFDGSHQLSDFNFSVATDSASDGGAITTLSVLAPTSGAVADVYRFFDAAHGTQLLTQDPGERDAIISSRPDLKFEGVSMRALASPAGDPAATAVYRFFDTAHGTHFFTESASEKDALLTSRPDLVFEPSSTIWEHATQEPGDAPVFRFFDVSTGSHFYTASATERATVLATRPDLHAEGIAFYAPAVPA